MNKFVIIDNRYLSFEKVLIKEGFIVIPSVTLQNVYSAVNAHPDLQICFDQYRKIAFVTEEAYEYYKDKIGRYVDIIKGEMIGSQYPKNVKYNCVIGKDIFVHKTNETARCIRDYYANQNIEKVDVKQGYTKCAVINLGDKFITDDDDIFKKLKNRNCHVLKVQKGFVYLEGFEYGFIGGSSGYHNGKLYFAGNIENHPDYELIKKFAGCQIVSLGEERLYDVGTMIML